MGLTEPVLRAFEAMGTRFECVLAAFGRPVAPTEAVSVAEEVQHLVLDWHRRLSLFERGSEVSAINARAADGPVRVGPDLFGLIARCVDANASTDGAFDIAVGGLLATHGFRDPSAFDAVWGSGLIRLDEARSTVRFVLPGIGIDLGGVAKGFVLDLARSELRDLGVTSALVHGGTSSVVSVGTQPDGRPWQVRLTDDPDAPVVQLNDSAMSFSDASGRTVGGRAHIMDPRSGHAAPIDRAACVVGPSAEVCEGWSTALVVEPSLAGTLPGGYRCFLRSDRGWRSPRPRTAPVTTPTPLHSYRG